MSFEATTSTLRVGRATHCATPPLNRMDMIVKENMSAHAHTTTNTSKYNDTQCHKVHVSYLYIAQHKKPA